MFPLSQLGLSHSPTLFNTLLVFSISLDQCVGRNYGVLFIYIARLLPRIVLS